MTDDDTGPIRMTWCADCEMWIAAMVRHVETNHSDINTNQHTSR